MTALLLCIINIFVYARIMLILWRYCWQWKAEWSDRAVEMWIAVNS